MGLHECDDFVHTCHSLYIIPCQCEHSVLLQNYGNSSVSLDKLGLSELTPGPATWNVEVFVQALREVVSKWTKIKGILKCGTRL